jgi:hypothetical protein
MSNSKSDNNNSAPEPTEGATANVNTQPDEKDIPSSQPHSGSAKKASKKQRLA